MDPLSSIQVSQVSQVSQVNQVSKLLAVIMCKFGPRTKMGPIRTKLFSWGTITIIAVYQNQRNVMIQKWEMAETARFGLT